MRISTTTVSFLLFIMFVSAVAQSSYPADTVLSSRRTSLGEKVLVAPISLWQRLSYNVPFITCQFYPSCSNYAAQSISQKGVFLGTALAADRIVRCNPAALHYHLQDYLLLSPDDIKFHTDGRLIDPVPSSVLPGRDRGKSPRLAALMSAIIPGSGRIYAGRMWDGLFGFSTVALAANATYLSYHKENALATMLFGLASIIFYSGEILGAYRAAAMVGERSEQSQLK